MPKKGDHRIKLSLICKICKNRNYNTSRNKLNTLEKLVLKKYCKYCKKITEHKETDRMK